MTENERRNAEMKSIMKIAGVEEPKKAEKEEPEAEPKKPAKKQTKKESK